jgi:hypothetical protein
LPACFALARAALATSLRAETSRLPTFTRHRPPRSQLHRHGERLRAARSAHLTCRDGGALFDSTGKCKKGKK